MPPCPRLTYDWFWVWYHLSSISHHHTPSVIDTIIYENEQLWCINLRGAGNKQVLVSCFKEFHYRVLEFREVTDKGKKCIV
jgi:hypothetical protein